MSLCGPFSFKPLHTWYDLIMLIHTQEQNNNSSSIHSPNIHLWSLTLYKDVGQLKKMLPPNGSIASKGGSQLQRQKISLNIKTTTTIKTHCDLSTKGTLCLLNSEKWQFSRKGKVLLQYRYSQGACETHELILMHETLGKCAILNLSLNKFN